MNFAQNARPSNRPKRAEIHVEQGILLW